ncbi:hypothetical protein [Paenibacillus koleovorans]|uniref:hypothetical protein n=1 Tax=Paenibacillus koleovorans TaxID=121608 RepID=UPI000FD9E39D|nr:hypothetical protein [Paenibacillus koleovorans]
MSEHSDRAMNPISGESVEITGVYSNEWGREQYYAKGQVFDHDPMLGETAWQLVRYEVDTTTSETEHPHMNRLVPEHTKHDSPRGHIDRGDK